MNNYFNLVDEPFIPVINGKHCSLLDLFTNDSIKDLALDDFHYIAVMRLLFCIGQAGVQLRTRADWNHLSLDQFKQQTAAYLQKHKDEFYLYGDKPFLQIKALKQSTEKYIESQNAKNKTVSFCPIKAYIPDFRYGNSLVLREQSYSAITDGEKALHLIAIQLYSMSGKRIINDIQLSPFYKGKQKENGKAKSGAVSPFLGMRGSLYSFYQGRSIAETVWLNLLSDEDLSSNSLVSDNYKHYLSMGRPCWELTIDREDCAAAKVMSTSYLGRLVPLVRFCLIDQDKFICTDGIPHLGATEGYVDFMQLAKYEKGKLSAVPVVPHKLPWRELGGLLSFLSVDKTSTGTFSFCRQLDFCYEHAKAINYLAIWSGGLSVSANSGEQKISGSDDYVHSVFLLAADADGYHLEFAGELGFVKYKAIIGILQKNIAKLRGCINGYFKELHCTESKNYQDQGEVQCWSMLDQSQKLLIKYCFNQLSPEELSSTKNTLNSQFRDSFKKAYLQVCPASTAATFNAYIKHRPVIGDLV